MASSAPVLMEISTRAATSADESFLFDLYHAVRGPEFAYMPLAEEQRLQMIKMQFTWQRNAYRANYPESDYKIVMVNGQPVGRIWIAISDANLHLVDIAIHPRFQGAGIGTILVRRLQSEARECRKQIISSVVRFNTGSLRFHERLGFRIMAEDEMTAQLVWDAATSA